MDVPVEYHGREQSYLKHRVLQEYLAAWGPKLGAISKRGPVTLWYVDCFSGPWESADVDHSDTSIHIGLRALKEAEKAWAGHGQGITGKAIFVEKSPTAYARLTKYLDGRDDGPETVAFHDEFGNCVDKINRLVGKDPAFIFVDPTGWDGVAMRYIQPLLREKFRDVMINVMFNHINRFKDMQVEVLRKQIEDFFGIEAGGLAPGQAE